MNHEHDVHARQLVPYKMLKGINKNENDTANLKIIPKHKWIDQYKALWYNDNVKADHSIIETNNYVTYGRDLITIGLKKSLEELKIKKQQDRMD